MRERERERETSTSVLLPPQTAAPPCAVQVGPQEAPRVDRPCQCGGRVRAPPGIRVLQRVAARRVAPRVRVEPADHLGVVLHRHDSHLHTPLRLSPTAPHLAGIPRLSPSQVRKEGRMEGRVLFN